MLKTVSVNLKDIAGLVLYLAGDESAFATGSSFVIEGGETAGLAHNEAAVA